MSAEIFKRFLDANQQEQAIVTLADEIEQGNNAQLLAELLPSVDKHTWALLHPKLADYVRAALHSNETSIPFKLVKQSNELFSDFTNYALAQCQKYSEELSSFENESFVKLLRFMQSLFSDCRLGPIETDWYLCLLLQHSDEQIVAEAAKTLRWRVSEMACSSNRETWDLIFELCGKGHAYQRNALILWLRILHSGDLNPHFESILSSTKYWKTLQLGLISRSHELRKYSLSILQLSISSIKTEFENDIMYPVRGKRGLNEWDKFMTVYEIMAIDASLHQSQSAAHDVVGWVSSSSLIHPSWGFALICTGFYSTMESVRKHCTSLLLSIKSDSFALFSQGLPYLEDVYMPNMMLASHFVVRAGECEYGKQLAAFVASILEHAPEPEYTKVVSSFVNVLVKAREGFGAVRIYTALGFLKGVRKRKIPSLFLENFEPLFEPFAENDIFRRTIQTINLKIILSSKFASLQDFSSTLMRFIKHDNFSIFKENRSFVMEYLSEHVTPKEVKEHLKLAPVDEKAVFKSVYGHTLDISLDDDELVCKLLEYGVDVEKLRLNPIYMKILQGDISDECAMALLSPSVHLPLKCDELREGINHLKLISKAITDCQSVAGFDFVMKLKKHLRNCSKGEDVVFYYLNAMTVYLKSNNVTHEEHETIMASLNFDVVHHTTLYAVCDLVHALLDLPHISESEIGYLSSNVNKLWMDIEGDRLKLHEKNLHIKFIKVMLHSTMLACNDERVGENVQQFALSVIKSSYGRRGLMPCMFKLLRSFQMSHGLNDKEYLSRVLIEGAKLNQLQNSAFKLEPIIASVYRTELRDEDLYADVYGEEEVASRIYVWDILNSVGSTSFCQSVMDCVFDGPTNLLKVSNAADGGEEFARCQLAKAALSVADRIDVEVFEKKFLDKFLMVVESDPSPLVRVYVEWVLALHVLHKPNSAAKFFSLLAGALNNHETKPGNVVTYERILYLALRCFSPDKEVPMLKQFLALILPAASTNKAVTRHFSMSLAISIHEEVTRKDLDIGSDLKDIIAKMHSSAVATLAYGQYRSGDALLWDIVGDYNLCYISGALPRRLSDREVECIDEAAFKKYIGEGQRRPIGHVELQQLKPFQKAPQASSGSLLQTKSGAWSTVMDTKQVKRSDLIVVASLVDKAPNLGGICRLCDVLGAGVMTVNDLKITKNAQFKNVAVTADHWMPIEEVKAMDIVAYLLSKKTEGYTLIGLEQTDSSVVLDHQLKFPKKSLFLLGMEKQGIPGHLLSELDFCVEIKQVGIVRLMNIQTATAVLVHAYSLQHC